MKRGRQYYWCRGCGARGTRETLPRNAMRNMVDPPAAEEPWYDDMLSDIEIECELCEARPAEADGLCPSCRMKLTNARMKAARMDAQEKRQQARAAAMMLLAQGYVQVRLR